MHHWLFGMYRLSWRAAGVTGEDLAAMEVLPKELLASLLLAMRSTLWDDADWRSPLGCNPVWFTGNRSR